MDPCGCRIADDVVVEQVNDCVRHKLGECFIDDAHDLSEFIAAVIIEPPFGLCGTQVVKVDHRAFVIERPSGPRFRVTVEPVQP